MIRKLTTNDLISAYEKICCLSDETGATTPNASLFIRMWAKHVADKSGVIFGAFDNKLIGIISAFKVPDMNTGEITAVEAHWYVDKEKRRGGVGAALFRKFLNWSNNCDKIAVAHPANKPWMKDIFNRHGFKALEIFYTKENLRCLG